MTSINDTKPEPKALSDRAIKAMKPTDKDKSDIGENKGLRVRCNKGGTKTFFYRYRDVFDNKKLKNMKIGVYPLMSLGEARVRLHELKAIRKDGRCPATEEQLKRLNEEAVKQEAIHRNSFTVTELVELYLTYKMEDRMVNGKLVKGARAPKGQSEVRRTLYGDAVRVLGDVPAHKVKSKDIVRMIYAIVDRGANVQAGNVLRELRAAYEFAISKDRFDDDFANPAIPAKRIIEQANVKLTSEQGRRILDDYELTLLLKWLPRSAFTQYQKDILMLTLWTGCRTGEMCTIEWKHLDLKKGILRLKDTKTKVERNIHLPKQAIQYIKNIDSAGSEYMFPAKHRNRPVLQKVLTEKAWHLRKSNRMLDIEHWAPHDLRRTVRSGLSMLGCRREVGEAVLGHSRKGIEGTYDLYGYEPECKEWLQKWADHMDELLLNDSEDKD